MSDDEREACAYCGHGIHDRFCLGFVDLLIGQAPCPCRSVQNAGPKVPVSVTAAVIPRCQGPELAPLSIYHCVARNTAKEPQALRLHAIEMVGPAGTVSAIGRAMLCGTHARALAALAGVEVRLLPEEEGV